MPVFIEQIVKKKREATDILRIILVVLAAFVVDSTFLVIGVLRFVFPAVFAISVYAAYNFIRNQSLEFEYSVMNGELDVDSIAGRRKRKKLMSVSIRRFSILAPAKEEYKAEFGSESIRNFIYAYISANSEGLWFARFEDDAGLDTVLFFNPNERVLRAIAKIIPSKAKEVPSELLTRGDDD